MSLSSYLDTYYGIYNVPTQEVGGCFDALYRYNSLRCLVTPIFLLIDQFLYRFSIYWPKTKKFWTLEVNKKVGFFLHHGAVENSRFLAWKKVLDYNNLLSGSIQIEFHHSVFLLVVERLSFFSTLTKLGNLARFTTQRTAPKRAWWPPIFCFVLHFWHKVPII